MDEKDWDVLRAIYDEKNVTRAAQKLHITQPALTYRLKQLEEEFDIQIFVRGKRAIKFTQEGECLAHYAKKMGIELRRLKDQLQDMTQGVSGVLRVASASNFARYELPTILKGFHVLYPDVQFNVHTGWSIHVLQRLTNEEDHIGIIWGDYEWNESKLLLTQDQFVLISREPIALEDLPNMPRIRHETDPDATKFIEQWWLEHFTQPAYISMEVDKVETCKEMVLKGLGYGIIPRYLLKEKEFNDDLFIYPLTHLDGQSMPRTLWAYFREDDTNLSLVKAFVDFLKQYYLAE